MESKSKGVDLEDEKSVQGTIDCLDQGLLSTNAKVTTLSHELERIKTILENNDKNYLSRLETGFSEACRLAANAQQIINLRKLVLFKEVKVSS